MTARLVHLVKNKCVTDLPIEVIMKLLLLFQMETHRFLLHPLFNPHHLLNG